MRIVSLVPSATETLVSIGGSSLLIGRSHDCDAPSDIRTLPALTRPRAVSADHVETDRRTREALAIGQPLDELDSDSLRALAPDLILTQDRCGVCSIDAGTLRDAIGAMNPEPAVLSLNPDSVEGMFDAALAIGAAAGLERQAEDAVTAWRERQHRAMDQVTPYVTGPRTAVLEWTDPLFIAGSWVPQLVERAGARHPLLPTTPIPGAGSGAGAHAAHRAAPPSRAVTPEELLEADIDALVVAPCGLDLDGARAAARALAQQPWWAELPAAQTDRVAAVSGTLLSRPGPRLIDAQEWFVGWLNGRANMIDPGFPWSPLEP